MGLPFEFSDSTLESSDEFIDIECESLFGFDPVLAFVGPSSPSKDFHWRTVNEAAPKGCIEEASTIRYTLFLRLVHKVTHANVHESFEAFTVARTRFHQNFAQGVHEAKHDDACTGVYAVIAGVIVA